MAWALACQVSKQRKLLAGLENLLVPVDWLLFSLSSPEQLFINYVAF